MIFKVKRGIHYGKDGKVYKKGESVESLNDLVAIYGAVKFERDFVAEQKAGIAVVDNKPNIPPPVDKGEDKKSTSSPLSKYGEDVSSNFSNAAKVGVSVFEKSKWHTVVDEDGEVLNEKKLRRKDVNPFLEQYLDLDEEDDLDEDEEEEDDDEE